MILPLESDIIAIKLVPEIFERGDHIFLFSNKDVLCVTCPYVSIWLSHCHLFSNKDVRMLPVPMSVYGCHTVTKILHRLAGSSQLRERRERLLHVFLYGKRAHIRILGYKGQLGEGDHCQGGCCRRTLSIASGSLLV